MKKTLMKSILVGLVTLGMLTGCEENVTPTDITTPNGEKIDVTPSDNPNPGGETGTITTPDAPTLTDITLETTNVKNTYVAGETLDLTNLVVTASYSDSTNKTITDYTTSPTNGSTLNEAGEITVTVSYNNLTKTFKVNVISVSGYSIDATGVKATYDQGEALSTEGLKIYKNYSDNTKEEVTDYTVSPANGSILNTTGKVIITVTVAETKLTYEITVNKTAWTEEEAKLMADNLYGEVLPYTGYEESSVNYNTEYKTLVIYGGAATEEVMLSYTRALSFNGYVLISSTELLFRKLITTENGKRYVTVQVASYQGKLMIMASDPYRYEFPTDFAAHVASTYFESRDVLPGIQADYFDSLETDTAVAIIAYMDSTIDDCGYSAILSTAGWEVQSVKYNGMYVAVSPDKTYMISYIYNESAGAFLIIYSPVSIFWDEDVIKAFFTKYNGSYVDLPAFNVTGATYYFEESETNQYFYEKGDIDMVVGFLSVSGATAEDAANYMTLLQQAGFKVLTSNNAYSATKGVEGKGLFRLDYSYNPQTSLITFIFYIYLEPFPTTEFPQDEINELLGGYLLDKIPGYEGETTGFQLNNDTYGTYIVVEVPQGTELEAIEAYKATLLANGYYKESEESSQYFSENHEIFVSLNKDSGSFKIIFGRAAYLSWPGTQIAAFLGDDVTDALPAFTDADADEFYFEVNENALNITASYDYEEDENGDEIEYDMEEISNDYVDLLKQNGFVKVAEDEEGYEYYVSKNLQIVVMVDYNAWFNEIYFYITSVNAFTGDEWPMYHIIGFLNIHNYTDELPAYEDDFVSTDVTVTLSALTIDVRLETTDIDEIVEARDAYIATLEEAGFEYFEQMGEGRCKRYLSPNNQYEVSVMWQPDGFTVQIDEIANESKVTTTFPTEELYQAHSDLKDVLPIVVDGEATFETTIQDEWVEIFVMYEDATLIPTAMQSYADALVNAGFTPQENTAGYDVVYFSPDNTYYVVVTDWSDFDTPGFDIEIYFM